MKKFYSTLLPGNFRGRLHYMQLSARVILMSNATRTIFTSLSQELISIQCVINFKYVYFSAAFLTYTTTVASPIESLREPNEASFETLPLLSHLFKASPRPLFHFAHRLHIKDMKAQPAEDHRSQGRRGSLVLLWTRRAHTVDHWCIYWQRFLI